MIKKLHLKAQANTDFFIHLRAGHRACMRINAQRIEKLLHNAAPRFRLIAKRGEFIHRTPFKEERIKD